MSASKQASTPYGWCAALACLALGLGTDSAAHAQPAPPGVVLFSPPPPAGSVPAPVVRSEATASPPAAEPEPRGVAGWFPNEGFMIKSQDGSYALRVGFQGGYRLSPYWLDGESQDRRSFFVIRPLIAGNAFRKWIRFWTSLELAQDTPFLLDSFVEIQPLDELGFRIGQQYTPLSRHEYLGPQQILFPDWAPVADYFWTGRDKGITVFGTALQQRLDYFAGVYSGSPPRQAISFNDSWVVNARLTVNPLGAVAGNEAPYITEEEPLPTRFSFTLQGAAGDIELAQLTGNPSPFRSQLEGSGVRSEQQLGSADFWLQAPRFIFLSELYVRRADPDEQGDFRATGFWGQAGYMLWDRKLDMGARFNWLNASQRLSNDVGYSIEGQFAYYPFSNQRLVGKLRYGYGKQDTPGEDRLGSARLLFAPGDNHLLTAQLMLAI